jgi:hypothetical protein
MGRVQAWSSNHAARLDHLQRLCCPTGEALVGSAAVVPGPQLVDDLTVLGRRAVGADGAA